MTVDPPLKPRNETDHERLDRQLTELLQGFRVVTAGVQVLVGFLLTAPYAAGFDRVDKIGMILFHIALFGALFASICLCAPVFQHRILFRMDQKAPLMKRANRLGICGGAGLGVSVCAATTLTMETLTSPWTTAVSATGIVTLCGWLWFLQPFWIRVRLIRRAHRAGPGDLPGVERPLAVGNGQPAVGAEHPARSLDET